MKRSQKISLFGKERQRRFQSIKKICHNFPCVQKKQIDFSCVERRKNRKVIRKEIKCFIICSNVKQALRNPQKLGLQFLILCGFRGAYKKIFLKKIKENISAKIKAIFVHFKCCLTCVKKMKAIHCPRKFEWSVLTHAL